MIIVGLNMYDDDHGMNDSNKHSSPLDEIDGAMAETVAFNA